MAPPSGVAAAPSGAVGFWRGLLGDHRVVWGLALIPHAVAFAFALKGILKGVIPGNLQDFMGAAVAMLRGEDLYAAGNGGYCYPPLIAFLYQPLAMMGAREASLASLAINGALSVFTLVLVSRVLTFRITGSAAPLLAARVALFATVCTADKIKAEFNQLETNVFMLLAFTMAMRWVDRRPWLCGLALGFAFNIKYLPIVLIPYLLLRRRWSAVGWFAVFAGVFAALPALSMGWEANLGAWAQASGGLLGLFGVDVHVAGAAHVHGVTNPVSLSVTSGIARMTGWPAAWALAASAGVGSAFCLFALAEYRRAGFPVLAWPGPAVQAGEPWRGLLSVEWIGVLILMLVFSPFTNARHLYMLMDVNIAAGALLLGSRGLTARWPLALAAAVLAAGITLPPGGPMFHVGEEAWRGVGGPAWCMLLMYVALVRTSVRFQRAAALEAAGAWGAAAGENGPLR